MPGNTPQEAADAFLKPLQNALSVLTGHGKISVGRRGQYVTDQTYTWELNGGRGMTWSNIGTFVANMQFKIVNADPARHNIQDGKLTATTLSYHYHFVQAKSNNKALWRMHWHPDGQSDFVDPHIHRLPDIKPHWPTPRLSFETAIRWGIAEGAPLACPSAAVAEDRLTESESVLRLYATWRDVSDPNYPVRKKLEGT